MFIIYKMPYFQ